MRIWKMNGAGNAFAVFDAREQKFAPSEAQLREIAQTMAAGFQIPGDISIAGYDDTRLASAVWPPLTTIRQPVVEMGRRAAERLMTPDEDTALEEVFDFELIVRQSTGKIID